MNSFEINSECFEKETEYGELDSRSYIGFTRVKYPWVGWLFEDPQLCVICKAICKENFGETAPTSLQFKFIKYHSKHLIKTDPHHNKVIKRLLNVAIAFSQRYSLSMKGTEDMITIGAYDIAYKMHIPVRPETPVCIYCGDTYDTTYPNEEIIMGHMFDSGCDDGGNNSCVEKCRNDWILTI